MDLRIWCKKAMLYVTVAVTMCYLKQVSNAQTWTHGSYSVDVVTTIHGNYVYSAGSAGGSVEALFPTGSDTWSQCDVQFKVQWSKSGPPPWVGVVTYYGNLTGSAGTGSYATAGVDSDSGSITRDTRVYGNPFSTSEFCGSVSAPSNSFYVTVGGHSYVSKGTGSTGDATSFVYTTM